MEPQRVFGKEITNLVEADSNRYKRNYSYLHADRIRDHSVGAVPSRAIISQRASVKPSLPKVEEKSQELLVLQKLNITDVQMVPEYFSENLQYLKKREKDTYKLTDYLSRHKTVDEYSRGKLIDWLGQLHLKFKMFPETIFSIVSIVDQFLSRKDVAINELQLVGIACLYICAKFEETYQVPQIKQLVSCCAGLYTSNQILNMEAEIIKVLGFQLIVNSSYKFFEPLSKVIGLEPKNYHLAQYVLELSFIQAKFLNYSPSLIASAAIYLIKKIRKSQSSWNDLMTSIVGYKENQLKTCAKDLCNLLENAGQIQNCKSIKKKFSLPSYHEVTKIKLERKQKK